jgi:hypothetical protein
VLDAGVLEGSGGGAPGPAELYGPLA